jgi:hypothetical protein
MSFHENYLVYSRNIKHKGMCWVGGDCTCGNGYLIFWKWGGNGEHRLENYRKLANIPNELEILRWERNQFHKLLAEICDDENVPIYISAYIDQFMQDRLSLDLRDVPE